MARVHFITQLYLPRRAQGGDSYGLNTPSDVTFSFQPIYKKKNSYKQLTQMTEMSWA